MAWAARPCCGVGVSPALRKHHSTSAAHRPVGSFCIIEHARLFAERLSGAGRIAVAVGTPVTFCRYVDHAPGLDFDAARHLEIKASDVPL